MLAGLNQKDAASGKPPVSHGRQDLVLNGERGSSVNIDFGVVSRYFSDKGFGFVRGLLLGSSSEIFFHIKAIKKTDSQLAAKLVSDHFSESFHFWFETEVTLLC